MTIRLEMHCAAGKAKNLLGDSADKVIEFVCGQLNQDGGFKSRAGLSDLYYTVFGLEILKALDAEIPCELICSYLRKFNIEELDLVHLSSLVRCYAVLEDYTGEQIINCIREKVVRHLQKFTAKDGGYNANADAEYGSVYGCFLALGIFQDINETSFEPDKFIDCIRLSQKQDGSYANEQVFAQGTTPTTAAAITTLKYLDVVPSQCAIDWLLSRLHPSGGFCAVAGIENTGIADLLSTATTLHALSLNGVSLAHIREKCLDYLDSLWSPQGGFAGNLLDTTLDCEYTYYGLLALGNLSVC
jgi:prenyltransferase beta subunit